MTERHKQGGEAGVEADGPIVDPTKNVLDLVDAERQRQDDLRRLNNEYLKSEIRRLEETAILRSDCARDMALLRAIHAKEMGVAETSRLNAIRQVDQLAVSTAADRARAEILTLAATTSANAEAVRNSLTTTATTIAAQTTRIETAITERLTQLEKSSYEGKGKQSYSDPMMAELVAEMKALRDSNKVVDGKNQGISLSWVILIGAAGLIATVLSIGSRFIGTTPSTQPQIIYVPAQPGTLLPSTPPQPVPR